MRELVRIEVLADEDATERLGAELAPALPRGAVLGLSGPLGAGKTTFVRGAMRALGVDEPVTSPTFLAPRSPRTRAGELLYHVDLYRTDGAAWLDGEGVSEELERGARAFVEWIERDLVLANTAWAIVEFEPVARGRRASIYRVSR